jgi:TRAP-type C4-dicarboxylate transport system substrate-binding protein
MQMTALRAALPLVAAGMFLLPGLAATDPTNLKLSFFTSDRSQIYQGSVKPFVDAVNADTAGLVHIEVYFSGAISADLARQPQLVADDTADFALVVPGRTPDRFYDTSVMELAGLFRDTDEASRIFGQLASDGALSGYADFHVICAFVAGAESIHSRKPIASVADLKGLTIRVDNSEEADALERLNAVPVLLSINQTTEAVSSGKIDGATFPPSMLFEFGIGRVATHHFMIGLGGAPVVLLMNRQKFESLPKPVQSLISKYSGKWLRDYNVRYFNELDRRALETLEADPRRTVVFPNEADTKVIQAAYADVNEQYAASSDHNRALLDRVRAKLGKLRTSE